MADNTKRCGRPGPAVVFEPLDCQLGEGLALLSLPSAVLLPFS